MKKLFLGLIITLGLLSCSKNEAYDEVPETIIMFITHYWPNPVIETYSHPSENRYEIIVKNGPTLDFDGDYSWTDIDGNGMPLPEVLLFNELPQKLYDYLEGGEYLNQVFEMERDSNGYKVTLLNVDVSYDIKSEVIRED